MGGENVNSAREVGGWGDEGAHAAGVAALANPQQALARLDQRQQQEGAGLTPAVQTLCDKYVVSPDSSVDSDLRSALVDLVSATAALDTGHPSSTSQ